MTAEPEPTVAWRIWVYGMPTTVFVTSVPGASYGWESAWGWGVGYASPTAAADAWTASFGHHWHSLVPCAPSEPEAVVQRRIDNENRLARTRRP